MSLTMVVMCQQIILMADRRRSGDYKHIGGYVAPELIDRFKQAVSERGMSQSEAMEEALLMWIEKEYVLPPKDIHELVARNLELLRDSGVKSLTAIAKREALPTRPDFCKIAAALGLPDEEKKRLWELAYGSPKGDVNATKPVKPPGQQ